MAWCRSRDVEKGQEASVKHLMLYLVTLFRREKSISVGFRYVSQAVPFSSLFPDLCSGVVSHDRTAAAEPRQEGVLGRGHTACYKFTFHCSLAEGTSAL